jgi:adenylate kinase family enzyme
MQLMTGVIPSLQALSREGEYGRQKINQYTRYLTVPMALLQAFGILSALAASDVIVGGFGLGIALSWVQMVTLVAGAIVLMWLGELITEKGIGNGISFIIFAGIVSQAPAGLLQTLQQPSPRDIVLFAVLAIVAVAVIIYIQEGQRRIPIQYASRVRGRRMYQGGQTFLPLRVNLAGVIPIIFAISILAFPGQLAAYFSFSDVQIVRDVAKGALLDGYPRTRRQAEALDEALQQSGSKVDHAILIEVPIEDLIGRFAGRLVCSSGGHVYNERTNPPRATGICDIDGSELKHRADDDEATVRARMEQQLGPLAEVADHYRAHRILTPIDGTFSIGAVAAALLNAVRQPA